MNLPLRNEILGQIDYTKDMAIYQFHALEKCLKSYTPMKLSCTQFIEEYESMGHMQKIQPQKETMLEIYLPHLSVLKV